MILEAQIFCVGFFMHMFLQFQKVLSFIELENLLGDTL